MIIKSFELQKIKSSNSAITLIYGNNEGLKEQIINDFFIKDFKGNILNYDEMDIINNKDEFISNLLNKSLFEENKIIIISRGSEKIFNTILDIIEKDVSEIRACILDRPRHQKIIDELKSLKVKIKLISDGDVSGALLVSNKKYGIDIFLGIGGGPEGVLAASALDTMNCNFQGRFLFENERDINRAKKMGITELNKKYNLNEIISGDSIFCATGITNGDLVNGIKLKDNIYTSETLITHKSLSRIEVIKKNEPIT